MLVGLCVICISNGLSSPDFMEGTSFFKLMYAD